MVNIEIVIIVCVVIFIIFFQLKYFFTAKKMLENFEKLFRSANQLELNPSIEFVNKSDEYLPTIICKSDSDISNSFKCILEATNDYLHFNKGAAADFNILKDISERVSVASENEIATAIPIPLYFGLMGTFIGVGIGIGFLLLNGQFNDIAIKTFLGGVLIAMMGSFLGLLLTTVNNNYKFNQAKVARDKDKNDYYNFLQARLFPVLNRDLSSSLSNLKVTFERFNKDFSLKLLENLNEFNTKFKENIDSFDDNIKLVTDNLNKQTEFLNKVEKLSFKRVVEANVEIFKKFDEHKEKINNLFRFVEKLDESIENASSAAEVMMALFNKVDGLDKAVSNLTNGFVNNEKAFKTYSEDVLARSDAIKDIYQNVVSSLNNLDHNVTGFTTSGSALVNSLTSKSLHELEEISTRLRDEIEQLSDKIKSNLTHSFNFEEERESISKLVEYIESEFKELIDLLLNDTKEILENFKNTLDNPIRDLRDEIISKLEHENNNLLSEFGVKLNSLKDTFLSITGNSPSKNINHKRTFYSSLNKFWNKIILLLEILYAYLKRNNKGGHHSEEKQ